MADIKAMAEEEKYITLYGRLKDRFGDNGLVSVVVGECRGDELHLILWLMSCRVLKRGMEDAMLDSLVELSSKKGIKKIIGYYYPTKKNKMVENFYKEMGFTLLKTDEGATIWECEVATYQKRNLYIAFTKE